MGDVEVDMIGFQPREALLKLMHDRLLAEVTVHRLAVIIEEMVALLGVPDEAAFGRQNHLVAAPFDGLADDGFGKSLAIGRRGINQRDAFVN